jgi:hypothetical protein
MATIEIKGKKVDLRDRFTMADGYDLLGLSNKAVIDDLRTYVPLARKLIVKWELDGDPDKPETYEAWDIFDMLDLARALDGHLGALYKRQAAEVKNSAGASSSPSPSAES